MTKTFRLLDLFCGAGGAAMGYHQALEEAGIPHTITGIDINPMPRYPFEFIQADALEYVRAHGAEYDFIHASPVCKLHSSLWAIWKRDYPDDIAAVRRLLQATKRNYCIENVEGAPLENPMTLCGLMFGLRLFRHRLFELSFMTLQPYHNHAGWKAPRTSRIPGDGEVWSIYGHFSGVTAGTKAMQVDWMIQAEASQAIPPAYTRFIMRQYLETR